jgi:SAM-dependent methyltransferase
MSSFVVARALPVSLENLTVLDVCSGSGIQSMLAARRGACRVVALELDEVAVGVARANSVLNGLGDRIDVRRSDMLDGLRADERFDFVVCNTPHAPLVEGLRPPQSSSSIGNAVLWRLLEGLPARLTEQGKGVVASWRAAGHESSTYQLRSIAGRLAAAGLSASAYVDRAPDTVDSVLRMLEADVRQRSTVDSEVKEIVDAARLTLGLPDAPVDGFYNQLIWFERGRALDADREPRIFGLAPPAVT